MHLEIRGLEKLSFRERQAVMLKESGKSIEEISKALKISSNSVHTILTRGKAKGYEIICIIPQNELGLDAISMEEENDGKEEK